MSQQQHTDSKSIQDKIAQISNNFLILLGVLLLAVSAGHCLRRCHSKYLQQAGLTTVIGLIAGAFLRYLASDQKDITSIQKDFQITFLFVLLPPIIFQSGYNLKKRTFFINFGSILMYAFIGTGIAIIVTSFILLGFASTELITHLTIKECFAFGILISATDPVSVLATFKEIKADETLYSLIFGESIFNDAVTMVLFQTVTSISGEDSLGKIILQSSGKFFGIFIGSSLLGIATAFVVAFIQKKQFALVQNMQNVEISLMILSPYVTYLLSLRFHLSGIVSILFNGIFMAQYAAPNLSDSSKRVLKHSYQMVAYAAQTLVFIFLGMGIFSFGETIDWQLFGLIIVVTLSTQVGRVCNIWCVSCCVNKARRSSSCIMLLSGLRGAIAFALAIQSLNKFNGQHQHGKQILTATVLYALVTILILGSMISPFLSKVKRQQDYNEIRGETFQSLREINAQQQQKQQQQHGQRKPGCHQAQICVCCKRFKLRLTDFHERYLVPAFIREDVIKRMSVDGVDSDISSELGDNGFDKDKKNFMGSEDTGEIDMNYFSGSGGGGVGGSGEEKQYEQDDDQNIEGVAGKKNKKKQIEMEEIFE